MLRVTKEMLSTNDNSAVIYALAQTTAKIAAASIADLVDNSGGAADGALANVPLCVTAPAVGANVPTKAAAETALGQVKDACMELAAKIVAIHARVPAFRVGPTNSIGGTAADGTIGAITVAPAADNVGPRVLFAGFNTAVTRLRNSLRELAAEANRLATACGTAKVSGTAGSTVTDYDHVYAAIDVTTGVAPADSSGSVTVAESTASLTALRNDVADIAAILNAITSDTGPAAIVIAA